MRELKFHFLCNLNDYKLNRIDQPNGPLFHRWLPDSVNDKLTVSTQDPNISLTFWFVRRGLINGSFIEYSSDKYNGDPEKITIQAVLDAGPLSGELIIKNVSDDEYNSVTKNIIGAENYITLGKRIIKIIEPSINRLLDIFCVIYGQYWIKKLGPWDARRESIGAYCSTLQLKWFNETDQSWQKFQPNSNHATIIFPKLSDENFLQYITQADYSKINELLNSDYSLHLSEITLANAFSLFDTGDLASAFVEANTALELALSENIREITTKYNEVEKHIAPIREFSKQTQLIIFSTIHHDISPEDLTLAIEAINMRNDIVHDGFKPHLTKENKNRFNALVKVTSYLTNGPEKKHPQLLNGNMLYQTK